MLKLLWKIVKTPKTVMKTADVFLSNGTEAVHVGKELEERVRRLFRGSLAIREVAAGSSNAEEQELTALTNPYYDLERFGIHFVASPRHADMLMVTGPVSKNMVLGVKRTYEAMPTPKIVVAVGEGAINGGVFRDSYAIVNSLNEVIPVDYEIPGDPPSPLAILRALNDILQIEEKKRSV